MTISTNCTAWNFYVFKQTSFQMEVRYTIKVTLQTAVLSLLTTSVADSLSTLHGIGITTGRHHTSVNFRSKVCVNKRRLSHWTELLHTKRTLASEMFLCANIYTNSLSHQFGISLRSLLMLPSTHRLLVFARFSTVHPSAQHIDYGKCDIVEQ